MIKTVWIDPIEDMYAFTDFSLERCLEKYEIWSSDHRFPHRKELILFLVFETNDGIFEGPDFSREEL